MDEVQVDVIADPDPALEAPILVEGLPGVGQVGKLAVDHLIEELDSELVRRVHSEYFPPQVTVREGGRAELAGVEFHAVWTADQDLLILTGDYQAGGMRGHYRVAERFLDVAEGLSTQEIITLGGVPTGEIQEDYTVVGAVNGDHRDRFERAGVRFGAEEPSGGIVGTSGLLLGLGERREIPATCLMGETSGYLVDPASAKAVLDVLETVLGFEIDVTTLEERAEQLEEFLAEFQEQQMQGQQAPGDEDLRYFG